MASIKVSCDLSQLGVLITSISEKAIKKAVHRSITRTFSGIKTDVLKTINAGNFYNKKKLPTSKVKKDYFREDKKLGASTDITNMYAAFKIRDKKIPLIAFFAKRVQTALSKVNRKPLYGVQVKVLNKTFIPKGKFIGNIGKVNEQVFGRSGKFKAGTRREKIKKAHDAISMSDLFKRTGAAARIQKEANERMQREMDTNVSYFLSKL
jgi:hypothetical protein